MDMKMNPSTYLQVRENMEKILELFGDGQGTAGVIDQILQDITNIKQDIENIEVVINPPGGSTGDTDLVPDADGNLQVYGIRLVTDYSNIDIMPNAYTRDIMFELKTPASVGLSDKEGFEAEYVVVLTYRYHPPENGSPNTINFLPYQLAYGARNITYIRTSNTGLDSWGEWELSAGGSGGPGTGVSIIQSVDEPVGQKEGDYWYEPIS